MLTDQSENAQSSDTKIIVGFMITRHDGSQFASLSNVGGGSKCDPAIFRIPVAFNIRMEAGLPFLVDETGQRYKNGLFKDAIEGNVATLEDIDFYNPPMEQTTVQAYRYTKPTGDVFVSFLPGIRDESEKIEVCVHAGVSVQYDIEGSPIFLFGTDFELQNLPGSLMKGLCHIVEKESFVNTINVERSPYRELDVTEIIPDPDQPRTDFDEESLKELAQNIWLIGQQQTIKVRSVRVDNKSVYMIVDGERRWRACCIIHSNPADYPLSEGKYIGKVAAIINEDSSSDAETIIAQLSANIQRKDLNAIEVALQLQKLQRINPSEWTQSAIAKVIGVGQTKVSGLLCLLDLPTEIQQYIRDGRLKPSHGEELSGLPPDMQVFYGQLAVNNSLTVSALNSEIKRYKEQLSNQQTAMFDVASSPSTEAGTDDPFAEDIPSTPGRSMIPEIDPETGRSVLTSLTPPRTDLSTINDPNMVECCKCGHPISRKLFTNLNSCKSNADGTVYQCPEGALWDKTENKFYCDKDARGRYDFSIQQKPAEAQSEQSAGSESIEDVEANLKAVAENASIPVILTDKSQAESPKETKVGSSQVVSVQTHSPAMPPGWQMVPVRTADYEILKSSSLWPLNQIIAELARLSIYDSLASNPQFFQASKALETTNWEGSSVLFPGETDILDALFPERETTDWHHIAIVILVHRAINVASTDNKLEDYKQ